ncbi:hypothetical protein Cni_G04077 [Canna indica]|uniref:Uncharacterized protein n=1 Tax=Canna indica TaxID=4628 RepID=A0AAQ3Q1Y0_9LILI|nr:hypothetical protein Cni_G04077 [Canna indica]
MTTPIGRYRWSPPGPAEFHGSDVCIGRSRLKAHLEKIRARYKTPSSFVLHLFSFRLAASRLLFLPPGASPVIERERGLVHLLSSSRSR